MTTRQRHDDEDDAGGITMRRAPNGHMRVTLPIAAIAAIMTYMGFDSSKERDKVQEQLRATQAQVALLKERCDMFDAIKRVETKLDKVLDERPRR